MCHARRPAGLVRDDKVMPRINRGGIGRPTRRFRHDALTPQRPQIQFVNEDVDRPHRIVFSHGIVKELREQNALRSVLALNKALRSRPRTTISQTLADSAFSHSLRLEEAFASAPANRRKGRITSLPGSPWKGPDPRQKPSLHWERRIRFSVPRTRFQTIRTVREAGASSAGCGLKSSGQRAPRVEPQIGFAFGTTPRKAGPKAESKIAASL